MEHLVEMRKSKQRKRYSSNKKTHPTLNQGQRSIVRGKSVETFPWH